MGAGIVVSAILSCFIYACSSAWVVYKLRKQLAYMIEQQHLINEDELVGQAFEAYHKKKPSIHGSMDFVENMAGN